MGVVTSSSRVLPSTIPSGRYGLASQIARRIDSLSLACSASLASLYASRRAILHLLGGRTLAASSAALRPASSLSKNRTISSYPWSQGIARCIYFLAAAAPLGRDTIGHPGIASLHEAASSSPSVMTTRFPVAGNKCCPKSVPGTLPS